MAPAPAPIRLRPSVEDNVPDTFKRKKRGIIYVRVSIARQDMISPELQVGHAQQLADANNIDVVLEPIMDLGESGRGFEERKIEDIKQMARNGEFDVLILWIWSRFGRNLKESLQHLDDLMAYGIEVRAAREDFDGKTTIGRFAIAQMLNIAELESNQKSDQWKDAIERRKTKGLPHGSAGRGKFGYYRCDTCPPPEPGKPMDKCPKCKEGILKLDERQRSYRAIYRRLYESYSFQNASTRSLVLWLRKQGIVNWTGREIDAGDLYSILDSGFALGFVRYTLPEELHKVITREDGTTKTVRKSAHRDITAYLYYKGKHEAIYEDEVECEKVWDAYVARRLSGRDNDDKNHDHSAKYSVSGSLTCFGCGEKMHSMLRAKKVQRPWINGFPDPFDVLFRCTRHMKFKDCPGGGVYVTLKVAEDSVKKWLSKQAEADPEGAESVPARAAQAQAQAGDNGYDDDLLRLQGIEHDLAQIRKKEDKLTEAVLDELISKDAARRKRAEYDTQKSALQAEGAQIKKRIADKPRIIARPDASAFTSVLSLWEVADHADRRRMLRTVIRTIRVNRGRNPETKCDVWSLWEAPPAKPDVVKAA
ncbi:recombinase family protein [Streptomyces alfalfae]|uniref:recombinase family protein n=1 Tax=Streptomyces alfalfae TaxID=1642299 RepID=UPI001FD5C78E|nr:recombinase family protein [Streptomyces alfalfae]